MSQGAIPPARLEALFRLATVGAAPPAAEPGAAKDVTQGPPRDPRLATPLAAALPPRPDVDVSVVSRVIAAFDAAWRPMLEAASPPPGAAATLAQAAQATPQLAATLAGLDAMPTAAAPNPPPGAAPTASANAAHAAAAAPLANLLAPAPVPGPAIPLANAAPLPANAVPTNVNPPASPQVATPAAPSAGVAADAFAARRGAAAPAMPLAFALPAEAPPSTAASNVAAASAAVAPAPVATPAFATPAAQPAPAATPGYLLPPWMPQTLATMRLAVDPEPPQRRPGAEPLPRPATAHANLTVESPTLGPVTLRIAVAGPAVRVEWEAPQSGTSRLLAQQRADLAHALDSRGLALERATHG